MFDSTNPNVATNMTNINKNKPKMGMFDNMVHSQKAISQSTNISNMFDNTNTSNDCGKLTASGNIYGQGSGTNTS